MKPPKEKEKSILHGVEIEKGIPIPEDHKALAAARWKEVAVKMAVGDSVMVPSTMRYLELESAMELLKYGVAREPQGTTGTRVWRTS